MKFHTALLSAAVAAALAVPAATTQACFTVIVGKDLSSTGDIIVGHNEDNDGRVMSNQYWVAPASHKAGELIEYEPGSARIPQVEKTLGFWWQQTLHPAGYSFSDSFFNEKGVLITSNNCGDTIEKDQKVRDGGIGYGIRRLIAERATSARDAVNLAIELTKKYGYTHQGRTYTIADKDEAWQLALLRGGRYLARKVPANEMTVMSNVYSLANVNLNDRENVLASPDLVQHAIDMGTYKPARPGDFSDFNFRKAYHTPDRITSDWNVERLRTALKHLTGKDFANPYDQPEAMALHPAQKVTPSDVRAVLRLTNPWLDRKTGWFHEEFLDPSNGGTFDSAVYVLTQNPLLSYTWRTSGRPDTQFSYPQFMLGKPAQTQAYLDTETATRAQFRSTPDQFDYSPDRTVFTFVNYQNFLDWNPRALRQVPPLQAAYEEGEARKLEAAVTQVTHLAKVSPEKAVEKMHEFNVASFNRVLGATEAELAKLNKYAIQIAAKELKKGGEGTVDVVLFSQPGFDAAKLDKEKTWFGDGYTDEDINQNLKRARISKIEYRDVDGDGLKDAVLTFPVKGATEETVPGVETQLYLWTSVEGEPVMAFDTVKIVK
jgi:hypothetical protein